MLERNSYTSLETFKQCPYKYKLTYIDKHFIKCDTIATKFGSLIHSIEEKIGNALKERKEIDYNSLISFFDTEILSIKEEFKQDFYSLDKSNRTYEEKALYYRNEAIYRLEKRVKKEKLEVIACEKEFFLTYNNILFHGFIDRILRDKDKYIIEDIKTYSKPLTSSQLINPLQFVLYSIAFSSVSKNVVCNYDLPLCDRIQRTKISNQDITELLNSIDSSDFHPCPSPLCHWCVFSNTYPDQPKEVKGLCPYYSLWTRENKTKEVNIKWQGKHKDKQIVEEFKKSLE